MAAILLFDALCHLERALPIVKAFKDLMTPVRKVSSLVEGKSPFRHADGILSALISRDYTCLSARTKLPSCDFDKRIQSFAEMMRRPIGVETVSDLLIGVGNTRLLHSSGGCLSCFTKTLTMALPSFLLTESTMQTRS